MRRALPICVSRAWLAFSTSKASLERTEVTNDACSTAVWECAAACFHDIIMKTQTRVAAVGLPSRQTMERMARHWCEDLLCKDSRHSIFISQAIGDYCLRRHA
mmetsp:Transcript_54451/g.127015  ORF Transcript_54451/g.127015 Transcript_54451/m.127015 type:complete len:103 (-) Transcript_54451:2-310(-)